MKKLLYSFAGLSLLALSCNQNLSRIDATSPSDVRYLRVMKVSNLSVTLAWLDPLDSDLAYIEIFNQGTHTSDRVNPGDMRVTAVVPRNGVNYHFLVKAVDSSGNSSVGVTKIAAARARLKKISNYNGTGLLQGYTSYQYDAQERVSTASSYDAADVLQGFIAYEFDSINRITRYSSCQGS